MFLVKPIFSVCFRKVLLVLLLLLLLLLLLIGLEARIVVGVVNKLGRGILADCCWISSNGKTVRSSPKRQDWLWSPHIRPIQWLPQSLSTRVNRPRRAADQSDAEVPL